MRLEKQNIPSAARSRVNQRFRNYQTDVDRYQRKLQTLSDDRAALFGGRYTDDPAQQGGRRGDAQQEQRQQLLSGTDRLDRSTQRLRNSQALAEETENIGAGTLRELTEQRERIGNISVNLQESEGYVDRSVKTLRGMARRYCSPLTPPSHSVFFLVVVLTIPPLPPQNGYESHNYHCHHHRPRHSHPCRHLQQVQINSPGVMTITTPTERTGSGVLLPISPQRTR